MALTKEQIVEQIESGATSLGIEYGSTRIKAVLVSSENDPIAIGAFDWENSLVDGYWTYSKDEIFAGLAAAYASMKEDVAEKYGVTLKKIGALGISAMMHGYLRLPHARALERLPHLPGRSRRRGARLPDRLLHHARGLRALGAHRREGPLDRRCLRHVPHRLHHP